MCGTGFGHPSPPYETTSSWNWDQNTPLEYAPCRLISSGVYQVTVYMNNQPSTDPTHSGLGTLDFKFFLQTGWTPELDASTFEVGTPLHVLNQTGFVGNLNGLTTPFEGVYRITIDENKKTITSVKIN
jgi:hypothetical protein